MPKAIIDFLQSIEIEQEEREFSFGAFGSADFCVQHLEKPAMIRQTSQRVAQRLLPEMILKRTLFGDIHHDDFATHKISPFVKDAASAEPSLQGGAVLSPPLDFDWFDSHRLG